MRRAILSLLLASMLGGQQIVVIKKKAGGGGGPVSFSDNFDRADSDSLGASWSEDQGDIDIATNRLRMAGGSFVYHWAIHATPTSTVNQYVKVLSPTGNNQYAQVALRYTNSSSAFYFLELDVTSDSWEWFHMTNSNGTSTSIQKVTLGAGATNVAFGITITGTGASTVIRIWRNPTGNAPDSATSWGGNTSPSYTFTNDPGSPIDTGLKVGLGGQQSAANTVIWDDFYGGDIP